MQEGKPLIDFEWIFEHLDDIAEAIVQHLQLTILPLILGFVISLAPVGLGRPPAADLRRR